MRENSMLTSFRRFRHKLKADLWKRRGSVPGAPGSNAAKWLAIEEAILTGQAGNFGYDAAGIDERAVEYPWVFQRLSQIDRPGGRILDAGSILNHKRILDLWSRCGRSPVSIVTLAFEGSAHVSNDVRYEFGDLRNLPYRDEWFSTTLCISTLEHVGLDNSLYVSGSKTSADPTAEALRSMKEMRRVTRPGGTLLLSVPFGRRSDRGWLRVFDADDLDRVVAPSGWNLVQSRFFLATENGWRETSQEHARHAGYNEPDERLGLRTASPFVAAAEAVVLVELCR